MFNLLDILFPRFCLGCGKEGQYICSECQTFLGEASLICPVCSKPSFAGEKHKDCFARYGLDGLTSIWEYEGIVKQIIYNAKYKGISHALSDVAVSSFEAMLKDETRFKPFFHFLFLPHVYIGYVPMFGKKERRRGFNQALLIAKEIGKIVGKPVVNLLSKTRDTVSQTDLDREERMENVKDSFSLLREQSSENKLFSSSPLFVPKRRDFTSPKPHDSKSSFSSPSITEKSVFSANFSILLVDDVWTTGATMRECCKILKKAGAEQVWGFTLARTV